MKLGGRDVASWWNSLQVRLVIMMSLALLPIGLIAITQTREVTEKARSNTELAMLALVEQSALMERLAIQRALGAAEAIAEQWELIDADPEQCSDWMRNLVEHSDRFSFAGLLPRSGQMVCSSANVTRDLSRSESFQELMQSEGPQVRVNPQAQFSQTAVINVSVPYRSNSQIAGRVSISAPLSRLDADRPEFPSGALKQAVTFNQNGEIMALSGDPDDLRDGLPQGMTLRTFADTHSRAFSAPNRLGEDRIYAVVPIEVGQLYSLGIWDAEVGLEEQIGSRVSPILFPMLMWLTSLIVVLYGIHRLVSRHIRNLRRQMQRFADQRAVPLAQENVEMPAELQEIYQSFSAMAYSLVRDEAALEDAVREKNVLIREIHHRVKNNLQLISSIVNMQVRNSDSADVRAALRRVQERVLSLATIHRDLYQSNTAGLVNVGNLITEIVQKSIEIGAETSETVELKTEIEDILLYPDQAVPMSLLAAEAATNAMKYVSAREGTAPWIKVEFTAGTGRQRIFRFANSVAGATGADGSGLGTKLIRAFAVQLGAEIDIQETESDYVMTVVFDAMEGVPDPVDY